jgi:hypothetical protein
MKLGIYKHYKGMLYRVHQVVLHSETLEPHVYYEALYTNGLGQFWIRPKKMFEETVVIEGKTMPRFEYVGDEKGSKRV